MNKKIFKFEAIGFVFVSALGTINHFLYDWITSPIIAAFAPVNESIWEHLKLLFFPFLIWTIVEYFVLKKDSRLFFSKIISVLAGMIFLISFYYTYTGAFGEMIDALNIVSFFLGVLLAFFISYTLLNSSKKKSRCAENISIGIFIFVAALFAIFTFSPPLIPLFEDPQNFTYGI